MKKNIFQLLLLIFISSCDSNSKEINTKIEFETKMTTKVRKKELVQEKNEKDIEFVGKEKTIHILVALCDNKYQGIVPVPEKIGNGQNPKSNLYWGAGFGIKTFFGRSNEWELLETKKVSDTILERMIFKHNKNDYYIVADAYDGKNIKETVTDFLKSVSGIKKDTIQIDNTIIGINGNSKLIAYIGHNGLMDFDLDKTYKNVDEKKRDAIILACISQDYFSKYLKDANANPIVWTTGLMAPEAYTIHDALIGYTNKETDEQIRLRAAKAYSKYQKCSIRAAKNLLVNGW